MAIKAFFNGRNVFVCLLTGFGRSLCCASLPTEVTSTVVFDIVNGHHEYGDGHVYIFFRFRFQAPSEFISARKITSANISVLTSTFFSLHKLINSYVT